MITSRLLNVLRTIVFIAPLVTFSTSLVHKSPSLSSPLQPLPRSTATTTSESVGHSRRSFFSSAAAIAAATATMTSSPQSAEAKWFWQKDISSTSYETFKNLLNSDQVAQVEFGIDGNSLSFLDSNDVTYTLVDIPDERGLLKELYTRGVTVSLQEMKYEKKMNAVSWFRDLVGVGDDITEEEMYEFRGYKTYRQNIPERAYVPSNLITGYDLSRNMR